MLIAIELFLPTYNPLINFSCFNEDSNSYYESSVAAGMHGLL